MRITQFQKYFIILILGVWFLQGCGNDQYIPDTSNIKIDAQIIRFDQELFGLDTNNLATSFSQLQKKYPRFSDRFFKFSMPVLMSETPIEELQRALSFEGMQKLYDTTQIVYPNLDELEQQTENMLRFYTYYFPEDSTLDTNNPKIFAFLSGYNEGVYIEPDYIGIGLDFFMGEDHMTYMAIPNLKHSYIRRTLNKAHMMSYLAYSLADQIVANHARIGGNQLIDHMLYKGKIFALVEAFLPHTPDSIQYQFSKEQMHKCVVGEAGLYEYLVDAKLLHSDRMDDFRNLINVGPFNNETGLYGNSGSWLGAQMVLDFWNSKRIEFENQHPEWSDREIDAAAWATTLKESESGVILREYKPDH